MKSQARVNSSTESIRRVRDKVPWRLWYAGTIALWEQAAFWAMTVPWQNYIQYADKQSDRLQPPGALGLGQSVATCISCGFYIFYYTAPTVGALLSDTRWGRYVTLLASLGVYLSGSVVLTISALPWSLREGWGLIGLIVAMILIGIGGGSFRAGIVPFIADQYTATTPRLERSSDRDGSLVEVDGALTLQYIYNVYYWAGNVGSLSWIATVYLEKRVGFAASYGLGMALITIATASLVAGRRHFVKIPHNRAVMSPGKDLIVAICKAGFCLYKADPTYQLENHRRQVTWSTELFAEVSKTLDLLRMLVLFVVFYICFDQVQNNLISQASSMSTQGIPNDTIPLANQVSCILLGPLIQGVLYPRLSRRGTYLRPQVRIAVGFGLMTISMAYAAVLQRFIYMSSSTSSARPSTPISGPKVSIWSQVPIYVLMSAGEIFAYVTALELTYDHAPKDLKVAVQAISLLLGALGSALAMALTPIARDPLMVLYYSLLTAAMGLATVLFWVIFRKHSIRPE